MSFPARALTSHSLCGQNVLLPLPAQPTDVCMWFASLAARQLKAKTIDNYRWALHSLHTQWGVPSVLSSNPQIDRMIEGIKKTYGVEPARPPRLPITPAIIRAISAHLSPTDPDHRMLRAAMWTACIGMLRPGELAVENAKKPKRLLTVASLKREPCDPPRFTLILTESKT